MVKSIVDWALVVIVWSMSVSLYAFGSDIPPGAVKYGPVLVKNQRAIWPDAPIPSFLAGQVEQESCITLSHSKCWNPRAELKTARENGVGFGQFTRAYNKDGSIRFDTISALAKAHSSLRGWSWAKRYDPDYQLRAIVEMDKGLYLRQQGAATTIDRLSFALSGYNGGESGVLQDRRLCQNSPNCDPSVWSGNVEKTSLKSRRAQKGYGKSFFAINREYVTNVIDVRRHKYEYLFKW